MADKLRPFRAWCQKVLPLVYDDSLSYYELLCKVVNYINGIIATNNEQTEDIAGIKEGLEELKNYVDNYFSSLDVQEEINNKLDSMYEMGELDKFVNPYQLLHKNCIFYGDSITWGDSGDSAHSQVAKPFPQYIAEISGCNAVNMGAKSATMAVVANSSNNLQTQINAYDISNMDYVFISFGINDFVQGVAISSNDSTEWESYFGAMYRAVQLIRQKNQKAQIIFIGVSPSQYYYTYLRNSMSLDIRTYIDAVKWFCNENGFKYIDLLKNSGIDETNYSTYSPDNVHFTQEGYNLIGQCVLNNLGGNSTALYDGVNVWDNMLIVSHTKIGEYSINSQGAPSQLTSFNPVTFGAGLYLVEYDYSGIGSTYNMADGFVGIHFRCGSSYMGSCTGIKLDGLTHHIRYWTNKPSEISGIVSFSFVTNISNVSATELNISNVRVCCYRGYESHSKEITVTALQGDGFCVITRSDSRIGVRFQSTMSTQVSAYTPLASSYALVLLDYDRQTRYFPASVGTSNITRAQIINNNLAVASPIDSGNTVAFTITYG